MDVLIERCAGLDVHRDTVVATVRRPGPGGRRRSQTRTFSTMTGQLQALSDWLMAEKVTLVGMESTGVYWKPVYYVLEERFPVWVINAEHLRNVPGRKTDVADSVWISQLLEHGLVSPSFVPPRQIRLLRDLTRHGRRLTEERTRTIQRLEKVLQDAGIKLTSVASTILGKTGRAILAALLAGEEDPTVLADLAKGRLRPKIPELREALTHRFRLEHHGLLIAQMLAHVDFLEDSIAQTYQQVDVLLRPVADVVELVQTIPGVGRRVAEVLVAEVGLDMTAFPTAAHLASWAGICPGNNASGGKRRTARTRHGSMWLRTALTEAAHSAARGKNTYLAAHHAQIRGRRGTQKAIGATRHDILIAYFHIIRDRTPYRELGPGWNNRRRSTEQQARRLLRQLERIGVNVTVHNTE
ncbi:IS110 family transposase [Pseudonocardia sp. RS11V-5]|uniref:IS110 family transposase n=1 Tax=Pseudonocardia terrae TaxID=2905831 RepID=UPI001E51A39D|nr:IS110 family transposase [Pseudonocardia terrae]MCE3556537.1 IS110 family transposase [Pseudonocardia terrae]